MDEPDNPYAAPHAPLRESAPVARPAIVAVLAGLLVDNVGTFVCGFALILGYGAWAIHAGAPPESLATLATAPGLRAANIVVGTAFSILGGYVCARIAARRELALGAVQGTISAAIGLLMSAGTGPLEDVLLSTATVAAVLAGSALGRRANIRRTTRASR